MPGGAYAGGAGGAYQPPGPAGPRHPPRRSGRRAVRRAAPAPERRGQLVPGVLVAGVRSPGGAAVRPHQQSGRAGSPEAARGAHPHPVAVPRGACADPGDIGEIEQQPAPVVQMDGEPGAVGEFQVRCAAAGRRMVAGQVVTLPDTGDLLGEEGGGVTVPVGSASTPRSAGACGSGRIRATWPGATPGPTRAGFSRAARCASTRPGSIPRR